MAPRIVTHPTSGQQFHVGGRRTPPVLPVPGILPLRRFLVHEQLPVPPASINYTTAVPNVVSQMDNNDTEGDCVIACAAHVVGVSTGNANNPSGGLLFTSDQINAMYGWCGFDPNNPQQTDQGCDIVPTFQAWQKNGAPIGNLANAPVGWLSVDPTIVSRCQTAIWLFENLVIGIGLPDDIVQNMPNQSGFVWSNTANPPDQNNGHCVALVGYDANGFIVLTWGMWGYVTPAWLAKYAAGVNGGECYTVLNQDTIVKGSQLAPNGFDWAQLVTDFNDMGGSVAPVPTPTPVPTPQPPTPPAPTPTPTPVPPPSPPPTPAPPPTPTPAPPSPVPPAPPSPPPVVRAPVGSPAWLEANMSASSWAQCQHDMDVGGINTLYPAWLRAHLTRRAWLQYLMAVGYPGGGHQDPAPPQPSGWQPGIPEWPPFSRMR